MSTILSKFEIGNMVELRVGFKRECPGLGILLARVGEDRDAYGATIQGYPASPLWSIYFGWDKSIHYFIESSLIKISD